MSSVGTSELSFGRPASPELPTGRPRLSREGLFEWIKKNRVADETVFLEAEKAFRKALLLEKEDVDRDVERIIYGDWLKEVITALSKHQITLDRAVEIYLDCDYRVAHLLIWTFWQNLDTRESILVHCGKERRDDVISYDNALLAFARHLRDLLEDGLLGFHKMFPVLNDEALEVLEGRTQHLEEEFFMTCGDRARYSSLSSERIQQLEEEFFRTYGHPARFSSLPEESPRASEGVSQASEETPLLVNPYKISPEEFLKRLRARFNDQ